MAAEMDFDFATDDEHFRRQLREFMAQTLPADWQGICEPGTDALEVSNDFCAQLAQRGWLTQAWPAAYGGRDATIWRQAVLQEELWAHQEPRGSQYMNVNWIGPAIAHFGTDEQKQHFLPRLAAGDMRWGQGFSEPDAGSDLAALRCAATPTDGGYTVTGQKIWTSYGDLADYCFLLCRTEAGSRRKQGLSVLLVDLSLPGISVRPIETIFGPHRQNEIVFSEAFVPSAALLGPEGDGWRVAMTALAFERSGSARYARSARVLGLLEQLHGSDWGEQDDAQFVRLLAFGRVAELMNYNVMAIKERDEVPGWQASAARIHNALLEQEIADFTESVAGIEAVLGGHDEAAPCNGEIESLWLNAPTGTVTSGAYEIQNSIVVRDGLGLEVSR